VSGRESALPLRLEGLGFRVDGRAILHDVTAHLEPGPISVVLGPNGAGKSILLRLCHGLLRPSAGALHWAGPAGDAPETRALVLQRPVLLRRSAAANVAYPLRLRGVAREPRRERVARALLATGLGDLAGRPARTLSVGEQQRLALAQAWALEPQVVFLDEPSAPLDPAASRTLERAVRAMAAEGTKVVLTTHDLLQARRMADEVLFLYQGRLLEQTPAAEFFASPRTVEARAFLEGELIP
jgi:tungstate transport system ATP-binding protein